METHNPILFNMLKTIFSGETKYSQQTKDLFSNVRNCLGKNNIKEMKTFEYNLYHPIDLILNIIAWYVLKQMIVIRK